MLDEGLLNDDEYHAEKRKLLMSKFPASPGGGELSGSLASGMERLVSVLSDAFSPQSDGSSPLGKRRRMNEPTDVTVVEHDTVLLPDGQRSLWKMGIRKTNLNKSKAVKMKNIHTCPHCDFSTSKKGPLATHIKAKHPQLQSGRDQSIVGLLKPNDVMLRERARDTNIAFIIGDMLTEVIRVGKPTKKKADGRKKCKGAARRLQRSYDFKRKVLMEFERVQQQHPDLEGMHSTVVADEFAISRSQVTDWYRNKDEIYKAAHGTATRKNSRIRKKRGRFHEEESTVHKAFLEKRKKGQKVGPRWLKQAMLREVNKRSDIAAKVFRARPGWLRRFAKRWSLSLRRKTNVKRVPIGERVPKIKRWFAIFRLQLLSFTEQRGYSKKFSVYPAACRWSLDQVPAGLYDPRQTYETTGADRVHIASNGSADSHRFATLQVLLRNRVIPSLPRRGQPRLCVCFRGKGLAKAVLEEAALYHPDVVVQFQPKAWYDSALCNKWVVDYAMKEVLKSELKPGQRHLILGDNLGGQTKKCNPQFATLLSKHCSADFWNLLAGCTDEIQVVDAGFGALTKRIAEEVQQEWLDKDENWAEWTDHTLSASRRRVLLTWWYGEAYDRACHQYDFEKVCTRTYLA